MVTAPTGQIGSQVVQDLLAAGAPVRVVVRDPARLAPGVAERVEVVAGSHGDPDVAATAFDGADAVFWLVPPVVAATSADEAYSGFARPVLGALRAAGRVVAVSALGRGTPVAGRAGHVTATLAMDDLIASTGVPYRALTAPSFMENTLRQLDSIRERGVFQGPYRPDNPAPLVATRDIAAVAARVLRDGEWTGFAEVPVLGPEDLTYDRMAAILSEVLGRPVRYEQQVPGAADTAIGQARIDMSLAKNDGLDNGVVRTPENTTPTTFRQFLLGAVSHNGA
ncbi:NAD(P)H-binding protein [Cryptosporangium japonicum]|uniref:NAD(P)H-binding protein n=1 Tax=Cryptosporangium japonicum TaxID=80872 RepID=A0ABN0U4K9_9ACTN